MVLDLAKQISDALVRIPPEKMAPQTAEPKGQVIIQPTADRSEIKISNREIVVDQMYRGDYTTISEAIEAAKPGDRILVRPGIYLEGLVVDKPLEIVGEGERDEIIVQATGKNTLLFRTNIGRVANLTLRQIEGKGFWYGLDIVQGRLTLENCDISSQTSACVAIHDGADPRLRHNKIHDGNSTGVEVYDDGLGVLEDNDIFGNAFGQVSINEGGNPTLRRNKIHDGKLNGVIVYKNGLGVLEDNDIFGNLWAGVRVVSGGKPTLRRNHINRNGYIGIWISKEGGGIVEDNDLRDNYGGSLSISEDSKSNVRRSNNLEWP